MSEVTYFILYILQHNKERHQPFWSDPLNPIFCLSLIFLSGDAPFSPCAGATLACAGRGKKYGCNNNLKLQEPRCPWENESLCGGLSAGARLFEKRKGSAASGTDGLDTTQH